MLGDKLGKKYRIRIIYRVHDMIDLSFPPCFTCLALLWSQKNPATIDSVWKQATKQTTVQWWNGCVFCCTYSVIIIFKWQSTAIIHKKVVIWYTVNEWRWCIMITISLWLTCRLLFLQEIYLLSRGINVCYNVDLHTGLHVFQGCFTFITLLSLHFLIKGGLDFELPVNWFFNMSRFNKLHIIYFCQVLNIDPDTPIAEIKKKYRQVLIPFSEISFCSIKKPMLASLE